MAMRNGYNSPLVHGAVDDGIHVCRRTGKLECIDCFREYAFDICFAAGDYEMGEHYARLCALSTNQQNSINKDRRFIGFKHLIMTYLFQGKVGAAWEAARRAIPMVEYYHEPMSARIELAYQAELLCLIEGQESKLPMFLKSLEFSDGIPVLTSREEDALHHCDHIVNEAFRYSVIQDFAKADSILADEERFLLAHENLALWFQFRVQRIASLLLASESGNELNVNLDSLITELRRRATKACQWSAIMALDTMLERRVKLNPLGIPFPLDLGPYATEGTPMSSAQIHLNLPLIDKPGDETVQQTKKTDEKEKSALELEIESWAGPLQAIWAEAAVFEQEKERTQGSNPFPKADALAEMEHKLFEKILALTPDTPLTEEEFLAAANLLQYLYLLMEPINIEKAWKWLKQITACFPERGRVLSSLSYYGFVFRQRIDLTSSEAKSLGLPEPEELEQWIAKAFELVPTRTGIATTAGMIFRAHGNNREAQRYFSRANQIDRLNEYAAVSLAELYDEAERPRDALATIELYLRAGGRHPGLLWRGTQIAFKNEMPTEFLSYYAGYIDSKPSYPTLEAQRIWALCRTEQWAEAKEALDQLDETLNEPGRDRIFVRALCLAKLNDSSWTAVVDDALSHDEGEAEGLLGPAFNPCDMLWEYMVGRNESQERREKFKRFLFERGLVPDELLCPMEAPDEETEYPLYGFYRCYIKQPLSPDIPSYAGWQSISPEKEAYIAVWFVLANSTEEATQLALKAQSQCYPLPPEPQKCEQLDSYESRCPQVVVQGYRLHDTEE